MVMDVEGGYARGSKREKVWRICTRNKKSRGSG
jgi:hypothetical protein